MTRRLTLLLLPGILLAFLCTGCGGQGRLGAKALSQHSKSLQSGAAEGALLAEDASAGRTTGIYLREHAADLSGAVSQETNALEKAKTKPALAPRLHALTLLAEHVGSELKQLAGASQARQSALGRELRRAAAELDRMAKGLESA